MPPNPLSLIDDPALDAVFDAVPIPPQIQWCPYCKKLIVECDETFWCVNNSTDNHYTAFCNQLHWEAYNKTGVFAQKLPAPLSLD